MTFKAEALELSWGAYGRRAWDFVELTKPRVVLMVLVTACVGFYLGASPLTSYLQLIPTLIGTALAACGTLALNQLWEREIDARMERTRHRPLPGGRIQPLEALAFGAGSLTSGVLILFLSVNALSAVITTLIAGVYLLVYTPLKCRTPLCTLVGAVPGALPPLIGWAGAAGALPLESWVLFTILFLWQIPHTLAIATLYRNDFARAGIQFLPVIESDGASTGRQVISHCLALLAVSLLPTLMGLAGPFYFLVALMLGGGFLLSGVGLAVKQSAPAARRLLLVSLVYLPVLLGVMAFDRGLM